MEKKIFRIDIIYQQNSQWGEDKRSHLYIEGKDLKEANNEFQEMIREKTISIHPDTKESDHGVGYSKVTIEFSEVYLTKRMSKTRKQ